MPLIQRLLTPGALAAVLFVSESAGAQTMSAATVAASGQMFAHRIDVNGNDLGVSTRPVNLTPLGINYDDCISNLILRFEVIVSGFDGSENMQVWATKGSNCNAATSRGALGAVAATCWLVNPGFTAQIHQQPITLSFDVRVQDLVGAQNAPPFPANYVRQGVSACSAQNTFAAVPLVVAFVPVDSSGNPDGTEFDYSQPSDLVGPPAPTNPVQSAGDTLINLNWQINTDSDTSGYDVFIDPIPGQTAPSMGISDATVTTCPDGASTGVTPTPTTQDSGDDGSDGDDGSSGNDGSTTSTPSSDSGCITTNVGGSTASGAGGVCTSTLLTSGMVQDAGGTFIETDEAGNPIEGGTPMSLNGGISTIPTANLVGAGAAGMTVSDKNTGNFRITGLTNNVHYNLVVAAVDGFGNVGPPSEEVCDYPALVRDFWNTYRQDGGGAGGGLCALEAVGKPGSAGVGLGLLLGAAVLTHARRARPRRSAPRQPRR